MKRISIISTILAAMVLSVTSCDMDLRPAGTLEPENAFQTATDAEYFHIGFYQALHGRVAGAQVYLTELQSDLFHATVGYGNRGGNMYNWIFTVSDGDVQGRFSSPYSGIANANYFITNANLVDTTGWEAAEKENLIIYKGEAFFLRAYYHMMLAEKFCKDYVGNEESYGIPYVTVYNATSDQSQYPDRGTLRETYEKINQDLDSAAAYLTTPGQVGSIYLTADVVTALRARVALYTGDYQAAVNYASSLINSGRYPLIAAGDTEAFNNMWVNDSGQECIMQLWADINNYVTVDYGYIGYNESEGTYGPDFIPEQWVLDLDGTSDAARGNDMRFAQFFRYTTITMPGPEEFDLYIFFKFPGNPELKAATSNALTARQKAKPFRIAEQYLILAEAYARLGNASAACDALNTLRDHRIVNNTPVTASGDALMTAILEERTRELIGEGFRLLDLRRFDEPVMRGAAQDEDAIMFPFNNQGTFHRDPSDFRFVFPIPQEEIDANPNLAGQQNEGYNN